MCSLTYLNASSTMQISATVRHLGRALLHNSTLKELNVSVQRFGPLVGGDLKVFAEALATNSSLTRLDMSSFFLGDSGVSLLCDGLRCNTSVTWLGLACNNMTEFGGCCLTDMLTHNSTLMSLTLDVHFDLCRDRSHPQPSALSPGVNVATLGMAEVAVLAGVLDRDRTLTSLGLAHRCSKQIFQRLSTSLHSNSTVTWLDVSHNNLFGEDDTAFMLGLMLAENTGLTHVNLKGNQIWSTAIRHIRDAIISNHDSALQTLDLKKNYLSDTNKSDLMELINPHSTLRQVLV